MTARQDIRVGVLFFTHLLLLLGLGSFNNVISRWGFSVHLDGLFVTSAALHLGPVTGGLLAGYFALALDASHPATAFGLSLFLWLIAYVWVRIYSAGVRHGARFHALLLVLLSNTFILFCKGLVLAAGSRNTATYWGSWGIELLFSALATLAFTGWFLAMEEGLLAALGLHPKAQALAER